MFRRTRGKGTSALEFGQVLSLHDSKKILLNGKIIKYQKLKLNNIGMFGE